MVRGKFGHLRRGLAEQRCVTFGCFGSMAIQHFFSVHRETSIYFIPIFLPNLNTNPTLLIIFSCHPISSPFS